MNLFLLFLATFSYVTLRAFQQRNVAFNNHWWVLPTSYGMAVFDVYCVVAVSKGGWTFPVVFANGTAGFLGCFFAMWFHNRFVKVKHDPNPIPTH